MSRPLESLLILAFKANAYDLPRPHPARCATLSRRERAISPSPSGRGVGVRETLLGKYASLNRTRAEDLIEDLEVTQSRKGSARADLGREEARSYRVRSVQRVLSV
jgi:hypothetical protein